MKQYLNYLFVTILIGALYPMAGNAQSMSVSVPSHVSVGENFRLSYTINTQEVENFRAGNIPEAIEVIAGPYTSSQSSFQMVNGHTSSSSSVTYTYTLYASKNGTYTIPAAHARVNGRIISSRAVKVTVSGTARQSNGAPQMHDDYAGEAQMRKSGSRISGNDLFIKVSANKRRVHEQEPILLTYKVYTLVDLTQLEGNMPDLTGFHTQEVKLPQQKNFHVEKVNGKNYRCVTWSQYVMYPQVTGKLEIPSITFKGIVVQQNRAVDPFEAFFNGGSGYVEVKRNIVAPRLTVLVDPLPKRPSDFTGGVGKFNLSASVNHTEVKAGEPISMRVVVGGIGNLKLIKEPYVAFPKDFDKYDAKITDKTKLTENGVEGNMIYDILAVPRNQGQYEIPPIEFTYYDTGQNAYRTIKTQAFKINVKKGDGKGSSVEDYRQEENDIRGLKQQKVRMHRVDEFFFGSIQYWVSLLVPLLAFIILLVVFRKRALDHADIVKMRGKKANKVATRRLKKARNLMNHNKQAEFYDEVLHALWGYVGDKLNMPVEQLSRENIADNLQRQAVDSKTIDTFISALDECEFERYAPGDPSGNMNKTIDSAMTAIMEIENVMKTSSKHKNNSAAHGKTFLFCMLMAIVSLSASATTKENADAEYKRGNYQQAIKDYTELLKQGVNADLYYNLGNAYYRTDNVTQAILAYERALMLSPGDDDIRFNLQYATSKTIDKITPESKMFFVTWYQSLVNFTSVDNWAVMAIASIVLVLLLVLMFLFGPNVMLRKIGFYGGCLFFVLFVFCNFFAYQQKYNLQNRTAAIVIAPSVTVKKTPANGSSDVFVIHEGTKVDITDKGLKDWRGIRLADGREGWLQTRQIEEI